VEDGIGDTTRPELGPVRSEVFPEGPVPGDEEDGGEEVIVMAGEREKLKVASWYRPEQEELKSEQSCKGERLCRMQDRQGSKAKKNL
jgi:hypothetical protein